MKCEIRVTCNGMSQLQSPQIRKFRSGSETSKIDGSRNSGDDKHTERYLLFSSILCTLSCVLVTLGFCYYFLRIPSD
ncbi:hypothetical protein DPMN_162857 [Dreissena polymorpha]|uniref:Uncharacterized protein n=1 Tax=Dreissena polymorpha TaxID=45954 RepID=A0A9D4ES41_DREPO|nr:hypothetical protein DPMN_162857 [Dreissena polymorpha]